MTIEAVPEAADHGHALAVVAERLALDFATGPDAAGAVVAEAYARTEGARVQSFRVLLAERDARAALRRDVGSDAARPLRVTA